MKLHYKEYNFPDWVKLSEDIKRDIQNNYWTPFDTKIGEETRNGILEEFIKTIDNNYYLCEFGYFAHYVVGIVFIPKDSKTRVPKYFYGILINKGVIVDEHEGNEYTIQWRCSGKQKKRLARACSSCSASAEMHYK